MVPRLRLLVSAAGPLPRFLVLTLGVSVVTRVLAEQKRIEDAEVETEEALLALQTQLQTTVGRLARLRRQKRLLKERGSELFRRGVQSMDELDSENRRVEEEALRVTSHTQSLGAEVPMDWNSLGLDLSDVDLEALGGLGSANETAEQVAGSVGDF